MAKHDKTYSFKGLLDFKRGILTEYTKDDEKVFDVFAKLHEFDGQFMSVTFKATTELDADNVKVSEFVSDEEDEDEDEERNEYPDDEDEEYDD